VLDADHEDMLARLSVYTLSKPSPAFVPLLRPLFTPASVPNLLVVMLLDWHEPWTWIRQLRAWLRLLRSLLPSLPDDAKLALEENIVEWRDRKRRGGPVDDDDNNAAASASASSAIDDVTLPLGRGEWDEPLGVPLCVVCQNAEHMATLERESGWKDRHFDFVQQFLRTLLLKHGASLCYSMLHQAQTLRTLIHSSLGIESTLKKELLRHNTTDRDMILVPPNFDSWGKIRILAEGFDFEAVSEAWSRDIQAESVAEDEDQDEQKHLAANTATTPTPPFSSTYLYAELIKPPPDDADLTSLPQRSSVALEVQSKDTQLFLSEQLVILEGLAKDDERSQLLRDASKKTSTIGASTGATDVEEHIGPVQFNMGGIQMDAEDMVKRLKVRTQKNQFCFGCVYCKIINS
jgi:dynein light intermediate chain 1